jgi:hypothetical protein
MGDSPAMKVSQIDDLFLKRRLGQLCHRSRLL